MACPYAAWLKYENALRGPTTEYLALGTAIHTALEKGYENTKFNLDKAIILFKKEFSKSIVDDEVFIQWPKLKKMESNGIGMIERFADQQNEKYFPLPHTLERSFSIPFEDIEVIGKIDREEVDEDGEYIVVDYKSGTRKPDPWFLRHNPQLTAYAWACLEEHGKLPKKVVWHQLKSAERLDTVRTMEDINDLKTMIHNARFMHKNKIRHRVFHEGVCNYCDYSGEGGACVDRELEQQLLSQE